MIKTLTAFTAEVDDVSVALSDILKQLDLDKNLLKNSIGIITCYREFAETGVIEALSKALPFCIIGTTSLGGSTAQDSTLLSLHIAVITSDTVSFSCALTAPLTPQNLKQEIAANYQSALGQLGAKPEMILAVAPFSVNISGDSIITAFDAASGSLPLFGSMPSSKATDYDSGKIIYNGFSYADRLGFIIVSDGINPVFSTASVSEEKILKQKAIITKSENNVVMSVNHINTLEYLKAISLLKEDNAQGLISIPFILDFNDGSAPVTRVMFKITAQGHALFGGDMPQNASIAIAYLDRNEVVATTTALMHSVAARDIKNGVLIVSCGARNMVLGLDVFAETEAVAQTLGTQIPYMFSYSGGEFCPVKDDKGNLVNRFHNDTIITFQY